MENKNPTEKQINRINRLIKKVGKEKVEAYLHHFFPFSDLDNMTKKQAQKIITGYPEPHPAIRGISCPEAWLKD